MSAKAVRAELVRLMAATVADEAARHDWTYRAVRPEYVPSGWSPGQRVVSDCSKGVQFLCRWAGAPDPMRENWDAYGNSSTLWLRLPHISQHEAEPGDPITFGFSTGEHHAAMLYNTDPDPLVWNMGTQGQPALRRLSAEIAAHRGMTVTFLKVVPDDVPPPPTPQDKLRAQTGFYAWVAWRLGEGPWRHYGAANRTVRPSVPRVISASWWRRYVVFVANRNRADRMK